MRELVVHIGMHKTGSTSIQQALNVDREMLRGQGVYVPKTGTFNYSKGHHNIAWELNADRRFQPQDGTMDEMFDEVSSLTEPTIVLSSEEFVRFRSSRPRRSSSKYARIRQFADTLSRRLRIVAFIRDYPSAQNSAYTQQIRTFSHALPFAEFLEREASNERWLYSEVFRGFEAIADSMSILPFEGDILPVFYKQLGVTPNAAGYERENVGFGPKAIEACRILYRHYSGESHRSGGVSGGPAGQVRQLMDDLGWNKTSFWGFEPQQATSIQQTLLRRDSDFVARHKIEFSPKFAERSPNDCHLEQMDDEERRSFLQGLGHIVASSSMQRREGEPVRSPREGKRGQSHDRQRRSSRNDSLGW